jgi:DNA-binding IclR family transcriptional regulator
VADVTRERIFETAEALVREGQSLTIVAVCTRRGGGSPRLRSSPSAPPMWTSCGRSCVASRRAKAG